jgi:hypothetical protein
MNADIRGSENRNRKVESGQEYGEESMKENGVDGVEEGTGERLLEWKSSAEGRWTVSVAGRWYAPEDVEQAERQDAARRAEFDRKTRDVWEAAPQGKLCLALHAAFQAYRDYLEKNPHARKTMWGSKVEYDEHKLFEHGLLAVEDHKQEREEKLRKNLEKAQAAARCQHEYLDGRRCKAPRMKDGKLCRMHERLEEARTAKLDLGPMEDADSIQVGIKKLQGAIIEGTLDHRQVGQLAYTIQLAAWNVGRTSIMNKNED